MLEKLIGLTADENTLFETILFEIESNYDYFKSKACIIPLVANDTQKYQVEKIIWRQETKINMDLAEYWKKKCWLGIESKSNRISFLFCRVDLTTRSATIYQDGNTDIYNVGHMVDPDEPVEPMTAEEIRLAFQELSGMLQEGIEKKSKSIKAI